MPVKTGVTVRRRRTAHWAKQELTEIVCKKGVLPLIQLPGVSAAAGSRNAALKTNLLYDAAATVNDGVGNGVESDIDILQWRIAGHEYDVEG